MRLLRPTLVGLAIGALGGLVVFLVTLFLPSNAPEHADGAGAYLVLLFIAALFAMIGGAVGGFLGFWLGACTTSPWAPFPREGNRPTRFESR